MSQKLLDELLARLEAECGAGIQIEKQREEVAARLNLDPDDVDVRKDILVTTLSREGVLVEIHIGRTRFICSLDEDDLGLKPEDEEHKKFLQEYVRLGNKYLLNNKYVCRLDTLERQGRRTPEKYGFRTKWGVFVPYQNFPVMREELEKIRGEYFATQYEILERYTELREETRLAYEKAAVETYRTLQKDRYADVPEEFIRTFVNGIMALFPDKATIATTFYFDMEVGFIPLTTMLQEEQYRMDQLQAAEQLALQQEKLDQIRAIHRETLDSYRRGLNDFLQNVIGRVYGMVYEAVEAVRDSLAKRDNLHAGDIKRLRALVEKVNRLNFNNDQKVWKYLQELRDIVENEARNPEAVMDSLDSITAETRQTLLLLGCEPRKVRTTAKAEAEIIPVGSRRARKKRNADSSLLLGDLGDIDSAPRRICAL